MFLSSSRPPGSMQQHLSIAAVASFTKDHLQEQRLVLHFKTNQRDCRARCPPLAAFHCAEIARRLTTGWRTIRACEFLAQLLVSGARVGWLHVHEPKPIQDLSLIHISEPTRQAENSYAV